jgi:hypothetical protein
MQVKWAGIIVAALVSGLLAACGGGGGGGGQTGAGDGATASSSGVRLSTKRVYGDEWQMSVQQTLQDKSSRSLVRRYRVEAVKPSGVYSLSIRASDLDGTTPDTVSTDQYDANNNKMSAGQCVSAAGGPSRSTFVKGEQWTTTGVVSCLDDDPVQTSWSTVDEMTVTKAGIPFHVYQLHRVSVTQPLVTGGALQDPSLPVGPGHRHVYPLRVHLYLRPRPAGQRRGE